MPSSSIQCSDVAVGAALNGYHSPMRPQRPTAARASIAVCLLLFTLAAAPARAVQQEPHTANRLRLQALDLAYNLDHDQALELLRRAVAMAPDDPAPHRSLAAVLWLSMLFRRGAVTVDHYLGSFSRSNVQLAKPPADLDAEFRSHVQRAIALAENRVAGHQKDAQAHFDLGAAIGLQASYMATVEGKMLAGFRAARRAYNENERVLELD